MKAEPISWDSTAAIPTHFLQVIVPTTLEEKRMMIPEKFVRDFGDELSAVATLTVPNGRVWHVRLAKDVGKIWFHSGWHDFFEYHSISAGYFLVFRYGNISNFHVLIFDSTFCEIRYPYYCGGLENDVQNSVRQDEMKINDFVEMVVPSTLNPRFSFLKNEVSDGWPSKRSSNQMNKTPSQLSGAHPSCSSAMGTSGWEECAVSFESPNFKHRYETLSKRCKVAELKETNEPNAENEFNQGKLNSDEMHISQGSLHCNRHLSESAVSKSKTIRSREDDNPTEVRVNESELKNADNHKDERHSLNAVNKNEHDFSAMLEDMGIFVSRHFGSIAAEQKERAINVASLFKPKHPAFMVVMRPRNVKKSCMMYVPAKFANKYLSRDTKYVKLQVSIGKEWPVQIVWRQSGGADLMKGWSRFSKEKQLEKGDMCLFELIRKNDILLKVSVCHPTVL